MMIGASSRSLIEIGSMIYKILIPLCRWSKTLGLMKYGCWCGPGTDMVNQYTPMDSFDSICRAHDLCWYRAVNSEHCATNYSGPNFVNRFARMPYLEGYHWNIDHETKQVIFVAK